MVAMIVTTICLTGCSLFTPTIKVEMDADCFFMVRQDAPESVKAQLAGLQPFDAEMRDWLNRVASNSEMFRKHCDD